MKRVFLLLLISLCSCLLAPYCAMADETVTVSATNADISENLDLKTVATLFGQAKDLEQFEQMLNNPDSAFSNLDLNGDGEVDYLRVIETADNNRHLVVIQAVLAKDIYQDVASIFVEKDEKDQVTVQVVGDEYIYGENYIIEPVYIYRPVIYDWFWGASWVAWHSPYYWGYYPHWWRPYYCMDPFLYWDHCYWHHYHYPICSYRTVHHHHPHYRSMHDRVRRNDYAHRHPDRSFATRNASRNIQNARIFDQHRRTAMRQAPTATRTTSAETRVRTASPTRGNVQATRSTTYGSSNVRQPSAATRTTATRGTATRSTSVSTATRSNATRTAAVAPTRGTATRTATVAPTRSSATRSEAVRVNSTPSATRTHTSVATPTRTTPTRSATVSPTRSNSTTMRSSSAAPSRSSATMHSAGGRSAGSSAVRSTGSAGSRTR